MKTKKINQGDTLLIPENEWLPEDAIQGDESKVLDNPVIDKAFDKILKDWKPQHDTCLISVCTTTRPYYKSLKWKKYIEAFGDSADMIVCSSVGLIPQKYWECYPYLTYDTHATPRTRARSLNKQIDRFMRFFKKHKYKKIVIVTKPLSGLRLTAIKFKELYKDAEIELVPTMTEREADKENKFKPYGLHFPELAEMCFNHTSRAIKK